VHEQRDVLREHFRLSQELHGEQVAGRTMRKFAIKYARLHPEPLAVRDSFIAVKVNADWQAVLDRFYRDNAPGRDAAAEVDETAECL
jgi:tRNA-dihydrouridine synthase